MKPLIVCLCGSTKFREEYRRENARLTMNGCIVLSVGCFQGDPEWGTNKVNLDRLHLDKIAMSDLVVVINKDGYIGESTKKEIEYAANLSKPIMYTDLKTFVRSSPEPRKCGHTSPLLNSECLECSKEIPEEGATQSRGETVTDALSKLRELTEKWKANQVKYGCTIHAGIDELEALLPALEQQRDELDSLKIQWNGLQDRCHADFLKIAALEQRERELLEQAAQIADNQHKITSVLPGHCNCREL